MKVDIKTEEKTTGFISKKKWHVVKTTVIYTEEEKQIIKENRLDKVVFWQRPPHDDAGDMTGIEDLYYLRFDTFDSRKPHTDEYFLSSSGSAAAYIEELKGYLKAAKQHLDAQTGDTEDESFEL
jgi:hypothetical protein